MHISPILLTHCGWQEEAFIASLTVRDTLRFAYLLRAPRQVRQGSVEDAVERVLALLHLEGVAAALIGDPSKRGISGGERWVAGDAAILCASEC